MKAIYFFSTILISILIGTSCATKSSRMIASDDTEVAVNPINSINTTVSANPEYNREYELDHICDHKEHTHNCAHIKTTTVDSTNEFIEEMKLYLANKKSKTSASEEKLYENLEKKLISENIEKAHFGWDESSSAPSADLDQVWEKTASKTTTNNSAIAKSSTNYTTQQTTEVSDEESTETDAIWEKTATKKTKTVNLNNGSTINRK